MNKWLTRFVLAMVLVMLPFKVNIRNADSVSGRAFHERDDRQLRTQRTHVEIEWPSADDGLVGEEAARWRDRWRTRGRGPMERGLTRMGRYEDYIDAELAARDLPPSLRYLPLIEADYHHLAVSPAGAAGLWQLMPETARGLGLEVNSLVDQRFDVYAATRVALDYLVALHDQFQCWFLALAAYNAGPTRIERAIRRHGGAQPRNDALFGQYPRTAA